MDLRNLIEPEVDLPRLSKVLDELGHPARLWAVYQWTKPLQAKLYEAAKGFRPVSLEDYVPADKGELVEVIHHGKNTLPMHTHFQKRFCKPSASSTAAAPGSAGDDAKKDALYGYNHQSLSGFTGPGYFVAHPSSEAGEVDIDYTMIPSEKPASWPAIMPNEAKLGRFVYAGMVDVMRGISTHVSIGRARKKHGWMDAWFVLVREDSASAA